MVVNNSRVKAELAKYGMSQTILAELMDMTKQELSIAINSVEWSARQQNEVIRLIREHAERREVI